MSRIELPTCHFRGGSDGDRVRCFHPVVRPDPRSPTVPERYCLGCRYREEVPGVPVGVPPKASRRRCVHAGNGLLARDVAARELDVRRRWHWCLHPEKPLGEAACSCKGCGPSCPGYLAEGTE